MRFCNVHEPNYNDGAQSCRQLNTLVSEMIEWTNLTGNDWTSYIQLDKSIKGSVIIPSCVGSLRLEFHNKEIR
jgi:hypothetical protein